MAERITTTGPKAPRIITIGPKMSPVDPKLVAEALGAEPTGETIPHGASPTMLIAMRDELAKRSHARSTQSGRLVVGQSTTGELSLKVLVQDDQGEWIATKVFDRLKVFSDGEIGIELNAASLLALTSS